MNPADASAGIGDEVYGAGPELREWLESEKKG